MSLHTHAHTNTMENRMWLTMALNFFITLAEVTGGLISGSLSLLSDAMHNLSDGFAIVISIAAIRLSRRPQTLRYTFGFKRAETIAAVVNSATLILLSGFLIREAIERLAHPPSVGGRLMLTTAAFGLVANIAGTLLLRRDATHSLNVRAAYFHLLSDAISSIVVILGAVAILVWNATWVDPILTIVISVYIVKEAVQILWEAVQIVMMFAPPEIDLMAIKQVIEKLPSIRHVHHVHIWRLSDEDIHFEAHVEIEDMNVSQTENLLSGISHELQQHFGINHVTLQFECGSCNQTNLVGHDNASQNVDAHTDHDSMT